MTYRRTSGGRIAFRSMAALVAITITLALAPAVGAAKPGGCQLAPGDTTVSWNSADVRHDVASVEIRWLEESGTIIEVVTVPADRGRPFYTQPTPAGAVEFGADFIDANGDVFAVTGGTCQP